MPHQFVVAQGTTTFKHVESANESEQDDEFQPLLECEDSRDQELFDSRDEELFDPEYGQQRLFKPNNATIQYQQPQNHPQNDPQNHDPNKQQSRNKKREVFGALNAVRVVASVHIVLGHVYKFQQWGWI